MRGSTFNQKTRERPETKTNKNSFYPVRAGGEAAFPRAPRGQLERCMLPLHTQEETLTFASSLRSDPAAETGLVDLKQTFLSVRKRSQTVTHLQNSPEHTTHGATCRTLTPGVQRYGCELLILKLVE